MKSLSIISAALALALFSAIGHATVIEANYTVNLNGTDPGLVVQSANVADNPFTFDLVAGNSVTFDLFDIWTDERSINDGEDTEPKPISVDFAFLLPEVFSGSVDGSTEGTREDQVIIPGLLEFPGFYQGGELNWSGATDLFFGPNSDGHLRVSLSDETFNEGIFFGTFPGEHFGATVEATITLVQDATAATVPEPGTLGFLGLGLLGLAAAARRQRSRG